MSEHPNATLVRRLDRAFKEGDLGTIEELLAPDVVWHEPGNHPLSGELRGLQEIMRLNEHAWKVTGGSIKVEVHDYMASDRHAAILQTVSARRENEEFKLREILTCHVVDGRVTEIFLMYDDLAKAELLLRAEPGEQLPDA